MIPRLYWGKAGGALVGIALASALADIIARTAAATPASVPLWPLGICVLLFAIGALLFLFRSGDPVEPHVTTTTSLPRADTAVIAPRTVTTPDEVADAGREFADATPAQMLTLVNAHTGIQAQKLVQPYLGKWLRLTGTLMDVGEWFSSSRFSQVTLSEFQVPRQNTVFFNFTDEKVVHGRLAVLPRGARMTIVGCIDKVQSLYIGLTDCEIESVEVASQEPVARQPQVRSPRA